MIILRFKSNEEHEDLLKKVQKMKKFASEIEECLEDHMENEIEYNQRGGGNYRIEDDAIFNEMDKLKARYNYLRNMRNGGGSR